MNSIVVFCASSSGLNPAYADAARSLGILLAQSHIRLVYGGGNVGLMGILADTVLAHHGHVIGVIPQALMDKELGHTGIQDLRIVDSMHTRKALMADLADAFIALPGGFGTLEEFFEILSWSQLGIHHKPFGLLNTAGYYNHLIAFLGHAVAEGLLKAKHRALVLESSDPAALLTQLAHAHPSHEPKWLTPRQT